MKRNEEVTSIEVDMQGAYELIYANESKTSLPIVLEYTGGGEEYLVAQYNGETFYYTEENGWYQEDEFGYTVKVEEQIEEELYKLFCGRSFVAFVDDHKIDFIAKELSYFLQKNNLEIYFENNSDFVNFGKYYVCDKNREIKNDKTGWQKVEETGYQDVAEIIIQINVVKNGIKYYQTLEHPEYV